MWTGALGWGLLGWGAEEKEEVVLGWRMRVRVSMRVSMRVSIRVRMWMDKARGGRRLGQGKEDRRGLCYGCEIELRRRKWSRARV